MTMTSAFFPIMLRDGGSVKCYAEGGLAQAAEQIASAGRGGDDWIIHINGDELNELIAMWGEPTINPETGMPEFFLKGLRDWFKENEWAGAVLPVAAGVLAPGIGGAIGGGVDKALGLGLGEAAKGAIGSGLVGAGLGALTGGGQGALMGGLLGAGAGYLSAPGGALSGLSLFGGGGSDQIVGGSGTDSLAPGAAGTGLAASQAASSASSGSGLSTLSKALPVALAVGAMGGLGGGKKDKEPATVNMTPEHQEMQGRMTKPLSQVKFERKRRPMASFDPRNYGLGPERQFFSNNRIPDMPEYASGGDVEMPGLDMVANQKPSRYVEGPGTGRSDEIPALVSNNEYIFDAETVALLGDGSPEAGAKALDEMRENIRRHKGKALAKGKISPDAKPALSYLGGR